MRAVFVLIFLLAGCAEFPELEGTIPPRTEAADFPDLVPLAPLLAARRDTTSGTRRASSPPFANNS